MHTPSLDNATGDMSSLESWTAFRDLLARNHELLYALLNNSTLPPLQQSRMVEVVRHLSQAMGYLDLFVQTEEQHSGVHPVVQAPAPIFRDQTPTVIHPRNIH